MSRHRFVRNLDLDAEMADESEEESGMTGEEQAQMATSLPIARELLKDIKPPIGESAIHDALWHYWFDVEKAVGYLRREWERKGEPIPSYLLPTPDQQRRRRDFKSARRSRDTSPEPPISALQQLRIARQASSQSNPPPSSPATTSTAHAPAAAPENGKPLSKLALLAQKRKEAAQNRDANILNASPATTTPASSSNDPSAGPSKPLSKLAQKMAAARAAKAEAANKDEGELQRDAPLAFTEDGDTDITIPDGSLELFPSSPPAQSHATPFFQLLTTKEKHTPAVDSLSSRLLHLPFVSDQAELEHRVRAAFGPEVESPDDIVLKARSGRASTTNPTTKPTTAPAKVQAGKSKSVKA